MSASYVLMGLLAKGERHGYDLKREHDLRFPTARPLAFGQTYATLDRLHRDGFIDPVAVRRFEGPDRTIFRLTSLGREELTRWLTDVEPPALFVNNPVSTKVTVALLSADERTAADYLCRQRDAHLSRMRDYTKIKTDPGATLTQVLAADYALSHLDADLRWIDTALGRVAALIKEIDS